MDLKKQQKRLAIAMVLTGVCAVAAVGALVMHARGIGWMMDAFIVSLTLGVLAQCWFIWGAMRDR